MLSHTRTKMQTNDRFFMLRAFTKIHNKICRKYVNIRLYHGARTPDYLLYFVQNFFLVPRFSKNVKKHHRKLTSHRKLLRFAYPKNWNVYPKNVPITKYKKCQIENLLFELKPKLKICKQIFCCWKLQKKLGNYSHTKKIISQIWIVAPAQDWKSSSKFLIILL